MDVKRMLTLIFGLALVSYLAMKLVWYMNPTSRPHYNNFFAYDYSTVNYVQFFILFLIPSVAAFFLYRSSFKKIDSFYKLFYDNFIIEIIEKDEAKAKTRVEDMCKKLLANLIIEDYQII